MPIANDMNSVAVPKHHAEEYYAVVNQVKKQLIDGVSAISEVLPLKEITKRKLHTIVPPVINQIFDNNIEILVEYVSSWDTENTQIKSRQDMILNGSKRKPVSMELVSTCLIPIAFEIVPQVFKTEKTTPNGIRMLRFIEWLINLVQKATRNNFAPTILHTAADYSKITRLEMESRIFNDDDNDEGGEPVKEEEPKKKINPIKKRRPRTAPRLSNK